jgi:hypothetical protein
MSWNDWVLVHAAPWMLNPMVVIGIIGTERLPNEIVNGNIFALVAKTGRNLKQAWI